ncbi:MAG: hypothetical protein LLF94_01375 [Chlamydiales bacterium]|nr:hypothetical protein [Chlamydiales bacterium]
MSVQSIYFNPFAFTTAKTAWQNEISLPAKIFKSATGAIYDLYVKNPHDLTVGNSKAFSHSSLKKKVAIVAVAAFATLYTLMLYGTSIHLAGRGIVAIGSHVASPLISKIGEAAKIIGEKVFVTGAVPIYGLVYALPKEIIKSFPKVANFIAQKVSLAAKWVFQNVVHPLVKKVIIPALIQLGRALTALKNKIEVVATWMFHNVLTPLWNKVVVPALTHIFRAINYVAEKVSDVLIKVISKIEIAATWVFQNVLKPLLDKVADAVVWTFQHVVTPALNAISSLAKFTHQHLLRPLARATASAASFVFQKILVPVFNVIVACANFLGTHVLKPAGALIASATKKVVNIAAVIFTKVIAPTVQAVANGLTALKNQALSTKTEIWNSITHTWTKVFG